MNISLFSTRIRLSDCVFWALVILVILPVWLYEYPAMVDLPQHVAQLTALDGLVAGNDFYSQLYEINWFTPYIISNLFLLFFTFVFSPIIALKIGITCYLLFIPLFTGIIARKLGKPEDVRLLTIPFLYCLPFDWGFIPFLMSISFGIIWLYYFIIHDSNPQSLTNLLLSFLIIYSHAIAWGLIMTYIYIIYFNSGVSIKRIKRMFKISSPIIFLIIWMVLLKLNNSITVGHESFQYRSISSLYSQMF